MAAERSYYLKYGQRLVIQPHHTYGLINGGSDNGAILADCAKVVQQVGFVSKEDAPDHNKIYSNQYSSEIRSLAIKANELYEVRTKNSLLTAIAVGIPCVVAVHVNDAYANYRGSGIAGYANGVGNHAICLDDATWQPSLNNFVFENPGSWGAELGDNGIWRCTWERHFVIPSRYHVYYAIPGIAEYRKAEVPPDAN